MIKRRYVSSLKEGDKVVFRADEFGLKDVVLDGDVVPPGVNKEMKLVSVCYMAGFRCRNGWIPYEKMLGVYNPDAEEVWFDNVHGPSDLLINR